MTAATAPIATPRHRSLPPMGALALAVAGHILVVAIAAAAAAGVAVAAIVVFGPALLAIV